MPYFDSAGRIGYIDMRKPSNRRIIKTKVGDVIKTPLTSDDCLPSQYDKERKKKKKRLRVIDVYPHWVRCRDREGKLYSLDLGDLVMLGVEPGNPGNVVESHPRHWTKY